MINIMFKVVRYLIISIATTVLSMLLSSCGEVSMRIESKSDLTEIFGLDFTNITITEISYSEPFRGSTEIFIYFIGKDDVIIASGFVERDIEHIHVADIEVLEKAGVQKSNIYRRWGHIKDMRTLFTRQSYVIELYQLREPRADGSDMLLITGVDRTVRICVDRILSE